MAKGSRVAAWVRHPRRPEFKSQVRTHKFSALETLRLEKVMVQVWVNVYVSAK